MGPDLVPIAANWSNWVGVMVTTHLGLVSGLFLAPRGPKRARFGPKCPFWGVLEVPRGPGGARFGPKSHGLQCLGSTHGDHRLWPGSGPLPGSQGPRKGSFCHQMFLFGPKRAHMGPKFKISANLLCDPCKLAPEGHSANDKNIFPIGYTS